MMETLIMMVKIVARKDT